MLWDTLELFLAYAWCDCVICFLVSKLSHLWITNKVHIKVLILLGLVFIIIIWQIPEAQDSEKFRDTSI